MRRTLGLDWGEKRIGVAVSDPLGITSQSLGVVLRKKDGADLDEIAAIAKAQDVERVIVGVPYSDDGSENASTRKALAFAEEVRARLGVPVESWDESYTSDEANRILRSRGVSWKDSKGQVDKIAAAVMLQSWLDDASAASAASANAGGEPASRPQSPHDDAEDEA